MKRQHSPTSKAAHEYIKPFKPTHKSRILKALLMSKVGATFEEAARLAKMEDDQVWKRLSELEREQLIFNTSITRKLKSGAMGTVWQLTEEGRKAAIGCMDEQEFFSGYQDGDFDKHQTQQYQQQNLF